MVIPISFSYTKLWKLASEKKINKTTLRDNAGITSASLARLSKNQNVSMDVLNRICNYLNCSLNDIIEHTPDITNSTNEYKTTKQLKLDVSPTTNTDQQLNKKKLKTISLNTISLFSGAGGLDLGLLNAGFNIVWANDILKPAILNYRHNIGEIHDGDITQIDVTTIPDADVVVGGFPCQPFSSAGNRLGINDDRGNLYLDVLRIIENKHPKIVIMENVRGLLSMKNEDGSKLIDTITYLLENTGSGYNVNYQLLKASDYGVPQNRYRVIIVGIRKDLNFNYVFPKPLTIDPIKLSVGHAITIPSHVPNQDDIWPLSPQSQSLVEFIPEGGSWKNIPYEILPDRLKRIRDDMKKYRSPNFYRRFARHEINGTITAAATPENSGILHPTENRRYSVREIARIQSFPDDYEFIGDSIASKYTIIGNAVPPKLAQVIGDSIIEQLLKNGFN